MEPTQNIDIQSLLLYVDTMSAPDLEQFIKEMNALLRRKKVQNIAARERQLLHKIRKTVLDDTKKNHYQTLVKKSALGKLTDAQQAEFEVLAHQEERLRNLRVKYMLEIAELRGVSLGQVMESLGLVPINQA